MHTLRLSDASRFTQYAPRPTRDAILSPLATESGDSAADLRFAGSGIWSKTCNRFLRAGGDIEEILTVGGAVGYGGFGSGRRRIFGQKRATVSFCRGGCFSARSGWSPGRSENWIESEVSSLKCEVGGLWPDLFTHLRFYAPTLLRRDGRPQAGGGRPEGPRLTHYAPRTTRREIPDTRYAGRAIQRFV